MKQENEHLTIVKDEEQKNEELIKRTEVKDTPFMIISTEGKHFGVLGQYRITEEYNDFAQCKKDLTKFTWNRAIQVISLVNQILKNN